MQIFAINYKSFLLNIICVFIVNNIILIPYFNPDFNVEQENTNVYLIEKVTE